MATERNVVDFKIHNLTEEQFQELKAQGKIDPNAVYCTPDESLKKNQITNCLTEIPQDIKLELADGVLTLKAGSIVYVPNGAGVFNKKTAKTDVTTQNLSSYSNGQYLVFDNSDLAGTSLRCNLISACHSGATAPATGTVWYDTTNNKIMVASGGTWTGNRTLPLGIVTISNGTISSIDQVFNGFGYIGSTVFALPGVKALIPDGRNEDGTLKNIVAQNTSVRTLTRSSGSTGTKTIALSSSGAPDLPGGMEYNEKENQNYNFGSKSTLGIFGSLDLDSNYIISNFNIKQAFHAVDYNDFENAVEELNSSISAVDSSAVHKTGDETVAGIKTFTSPTRKNTSLERGVVPSTNTNIPAMQFMDKKTQVLGELEYFYGTNGTNGMTLLLRDTSGNRGAALRIGQNSDGTAYANAPTPASTSNSTDIATTAWANAKFFPLTGGTMNGTITRSGALLAKRNVDNSYLEFYGGTSSSNAAYLRLDGKDSSSAGQFILATSGGSSARKTLNGKPDGSLLWDGVYVATTKAKSLAQNGYVKFNNGLIIQWGLSEKLNGVRVETFPVPFTGQYTYAVTATLDGKSANAASVQARTNTTFSVDPATGHDSNDKRAAWIAIGY